MKKVGMWKKAVCLLMAVAMVTMLAGCGAVILGANINADGTGTITAQVGLAKEFAEQLQEDGADITANSGELKEFVYGGQTYLGDSQTVAFNSLDELEELLQSALDDSSDESEQVFFFWYNADKTLMYMELKTTPEEINGDTEELIVDSGIESETDEMLEEAMQSFKIVYSFNMPGNWTYIKNGVPSNDIPTGVSTVGNTHNITFDFMEMASAPEFASGIDLVFQIDLGDQGGTVADFQDVPVLHWAYSAVMKMANLGVVHGYSATTFGPEDYVTREQLATMVCNYYGFDVSVNDGEYWATSAIKIATEQFGFKDGGTSEWWSAPATRDEAIYDLTNRLLDGLSYQANHMNIPDIDSIDDEYLPLVQLCYDLGILHGDLSGAFNPKGYLTRAEACQMFSNIIHYNQTARICG